MDIIESYYRNEKKQFKRMVELAFIHAEVVARYMFPQKGETEPPRPWEYFSDLFNEEHERHDRLQKGNELEDVKAQRKAYAKEFNRRRRSQ